jgi:sulfur carrier protein
VIGVIRRRRAGASAVVTGTRSTTAALAATPGFARFDALPDVALSCAAMHVLVNGQRTEVQPPCTIADLLRQRGLETSPCAVEVNADLVPRSEHAGRPLDDGDQVEIVTLVGGG